MFFDIKNYFISGVVFCFCVFLFLKDCCLFWIWCDGGECLCAALFISRERFRGWNFNQIAPLQPDCTPILRIFLSCASFIFHAPASFLVVVFSLYISVAHFRLDLPRGRYAHSSIVVNVASLDFTRIWIIEDLRYSTAAHDNEDNKSTKRHKISEVTWR